MHTYKEREPQREEGLCFSHTQREKIERVHKRAEQIRTEHPWALLADSDGVVGRMWQPKNGLPRGGSPVGGGGAAQGNQWRPSGRDRR